MSPCPPSIGGTRGEPGHHPKREVSFFAAGSEDIRARLKPIVEAGFLVEGVTTPCGALVVPGPAAACIVAGPGARACCHSGSRNRRSGFSGTARSCTREISIGATAAPSAGTTTAQDREIACGSSVDRASPLVPLSEAVLGRGRVAGVALRRHAGDPIAHRAADRAPEHRGRDARHARGHRRSTFQTGLASAPPRFGWLRRLRSNLRPSTCFRST